MWTLVNPFFLWGIAAAAVPLVLHLLRRRRTATIPFSTLRFLKFAQHSSSRRIRMENFLLWLLRTLLMIVLSLAFSLPIVRTSRFGAMLGRARRDVAIVLDASYSMAYQSGRGQVWDRARETAAGLIESLKPGDRVCVFLATDDVVPLLERPEEDHGVALAQISERAFAATSSRLLPALLAAVDALRESGTREREVHVLTDGQALPWSDFRASGPQGTGPAAWPPPDLDDRIDIFVTTLGPPRPENEAPCGIAVQPLPLFPGAAPQIEVAVLRVGDPKDTTIALHIDDSEIRRQGARLMPGRGNRIQFTVPPLAPGTYAGEIELPPDALEPDNRFHFLLRVKEQLPVLCVGSEEDTLFLRLALDPGSEDEAGITVRRVGPGDVGAEDLTDVSCIFLCNALPLPGDAQLALEEFVRRGGLLAVFPGDAARLDDYASWNLLPAPPTALHEPGSDAARRTIALTKPDDPMLLTLRVQPGVLPVVSMRRHLAWGDLAAGTEVILSSGDREPFLVRRDEGNGSVLLFAVSADRRWSSFPLSPFFLPFAHQIVRVGAGLGRETLYVTTTASLAVSDAAPGVTERSVLRDPAGVRVPLRPVRTEQRTVLLAEPLFQPGIYSVDTDDGPRPVLAVNAPADESDLAPISHEDLRKALGLRRLRLASDRAELLRVLEDHRVGRSLTEPLLWLALLLALAEVWTANRRCRPQTSLSEQLRLDPGGKVHGKPETATG